MPNITETISLLDEQIREVERELKGTPHDTKVFAIIETLKAQLRQAALDGERYRKAGEAFMKSVAGYLEQYPNITPTCLHIALEIYRQAVEQKEE